MLRLRLHLAPKRAELKSLHRGPWRDVIMPPRVDWFELRTKHCRQRSRIVANDRQPAAFLRTVEGKGADDDVPADLDGALHTFGIGGLIGRLRQEMKRCP